jgi:crotonobetainyl-CoA:carnitine CoA-transferase CaiB-like acyl-CoA transferase
MEQVFEDAQVQHLPTTSTLQHPRRGDIKVLNTPVILSRTPVQVSQTQSELGEHNAEVLGELGYSASEIEQFIQQKVI